MGYRWNGRWKFGLQRYWKRESVALKIRTINLLTLLGCVVIGVLGGALVIGLCWVGRLHLNSKQQLITLCGFTLMGIIYGVAIVNSPPRPSIRNQK